MNVPAISQSLYTSPHFLQQSKRPKAPDRSVTVQELYDMEDRINFKIEEQTKKLNKIFNNINQNNETLIANQNKMLGETLNDISKLVYMRPTASAKDYYIKAKASSETLKNNGLD